MVEFLNNDLAWTPLDSELFRVEQDPSENVKFTVLQSSDESKIGEYSIRL